MDQRASQKEAHLEPLRLPAPLQQLPWDVAKDQFGMQGAEFIGVMGALLVRLAKDQFRAYVVDWAGGFQHTSPKPAKDQSKIRPY
jgi:hypothetical protein